ncbi:MAG: hypothetical protein H0U24_03540, partial [Thermoleophilaceae bacterium]|nr:hypothetical protein [Thermoleophilaceae bacterium]
MRAAVSAALLGAVMALAAASFDTASLYLPAVALIALGTGSALWVWASSKGLSVERLSGPHTVEEEQPYPLRLELRPGLLPPPAGELRDPLLPSVIPLGGRAPRRVRIDVRFARRGRRRFERGVLLLHDPLRLAVREVIVSGEEDEVLVLPRVEPVLVGGAGGANGAAAGPEG